MEDKITYDHKLVKGDAIEIYAKSIANLGIFNFFQEKHISFRTSGNPQGGGTIGGTITGYLRGLHAYVARDIMDADGELVSVSMERGIPFADDSSRKISVEYSNGKTEVALEGSKRAIRKMRKTIDEMFNT